MEEKRNLKITVLDNEHDMYWRMALEVVDVIRENNAKGEPTVMVVPYGPLGPYSRLVYFVNTYNVSLQNCVFINMDEYLTDGDKWIAKEDPLSFRGGMDRIFYSKIKDELNVLPENRIFPEPGKEGEILKIIEKYGKLDMAWGGCGVNGHFAFNEPPMDGEECTNEEFLNRPTRCLSVALETRTVNAVMNAGGDIDRLPKRCITVGMKEMFMAKKVRICLPRAWNAGTYRKYQEGVISAKTPVTLFNYHDDAMMYLVPEATLSTKPEIVIYNKK